MKHTKCPSGYIQWHEWAEKKSKTHKQIKCTCCGLYLVWIRKGITMTEEGRGNDLYGTFK